MTLRERPRFQLPFRGLEDEQAESPGREIDIKPSLALIEWVINYRENMETMRLLLTIEELLSSINHVT